MEPDDIEEFSALMAVLDELYSRGVSKTLAEIYFRVLAPWTIEELSEAVWQHISANPYFPKPAELITIARTYRTHQLPPAQSTCAIHGCQSPLLEVGQFCAYHGG